jgi:hypothetical protein
MIAERYPRSPSVARLRGILNAVEGLVSRAPSSPGRWSSIKVIALGARVAEVNAELAAMRRERDAMKPKPMLVRGWPAEVDGALEDVQLVMQRLRSTWQIDAEIPIGVDDHARPVLEEADRTTLAEATKRLGQELDEDDQAELETQAAHVPLLEELDAGEPMAGDLAMPVEPRPSLELVGPDKPPIIRGVPWTNLLAPAQYKTLETLRNAWPDPIRLDQLKGATEGARNTLAGVMNRDPIWATVIRMSSRGRLGYRLKDW